MIDFNNPYILLGVLPLVLTMTGMFLTRFFMGEGLGNTLASAALVVSFMIILMVYAGLPDWPASAPADKLFYLALISLMYGLLLDRFPALDSANLFLKSIIPVAGVFWIFAPSGAISFSEAEFRGLALITILALGYFLKLEQDWQDGVDITQPLAATGIGAMIIAWTTGLGLTGNILLAYISALGGFMLLNLPKRRFPLGAAGLFPSYLILLTCLLALIMEVPSLSPAVLLLSLVLMADSFTGLLPRSLPHPAKRAGAMAGLILVALAVTYF